MSKCSMGAARRRGFTLVELLVVIGIIALLMSILLPALNKARENARGIKCASNEKQILLACIMYANENKSFWPIPPLIGDSLAQSQQFGDYLGIDMANTNTSAGVYDYQNGNLWPYISKTSYGREEVFNCPTDLDSFRPVRQGSIQSTASYARNFTYSFNAQLRGDDRSAQNLPPTGMRMGQIVMPGQKVVVVEEQFPNDGCAFIAPPDNGDDQFTNRHLKRGNQGFADGHVEAVYPEDFGFHTNANVAGNQTISLTADDQVKRHAYCDLTWRP